MGGALYSALNGEGINLVYDPKAVNPVYNMTTNTLTLKDLDNYHTLVHEMIHAYQDKELSSTYIGNNRANLEVEAFMARHLILKREHPPGTEFRGSSEFMQKVVDLEDLMDSNCNVREENSVKFYEKYTEAIDAYRTEYKSRFKQECTFSKNEEDMNLNRLKELSKDC